MSEQSPRCSSGCHFAIRITKSVAGPFNGWLQTVAEGRRVAANQSNLYQAKLAQDIQKAVSTDKYISHRLEVPRIRHVIFGGKRRSPIVDGSLA